MIELFLAIQLWCSEVNPTEIEHCTSVVFECALDDGVHWCKEQYILEWIGGINKGAESAF